MKKGARQPATVLEWMRWAEKRLAAAPLVYGHGTATPGDEAAALVFHAAGIDHSAAPAAYRWQVPVAARAAIRSLVQRRIKERIPSAYLTGRTWFAGLEMQTDRRALVPRSPLAELIEQRFEPFVAPDRVKRVLDVGTGSGCIAIAVAHYLPQAVVDAVDISPAALALARRNIALHGLQKRVRLLKSDHFSAVSRRRYDIIVSNPPYVSAREMAALPAEYRHEPRIGLASGEQGLGSVAILLAQAARQLKPGGVLIVEVGDTEATVAATWPRLPFLWLDFARGGGGVFLLTRQQLEQQVTDLRRR